MDFNFTDASLNDYARIQGGKSGSGVGDLRFHTYSGGLSEAMRIDSSGNLLVGGTSAGGSSTFTAYADGQIHAYRGTATGRAATFTATTSEVGYFNRLSTDGDIVQFAKDGTTAGSIGSYSGASLSISKGSSGLLMDNTATRVLPFNGATNAPSDGAVALGSSANRFDNIYALNGTIQTSDRNEKQDIEALSDAEQRVAVACKGLLRKFRWKDAVAEKGDAARIHFGIIAQDLQDAFAAEGLDAGRYGMFISSTWWEVDETYTDDDGVEQTRTQHYDTAEEAPEGATERTRLGVRYPELLAFIIAAI